MSFLKRLAIMTSGLAMAATVLGVVPAAASPAPAPTLGAAGASAAAAATCTKYGYQGTFIHSCGAILDMTWTSGGRESFGIAPNRTIWHAWPGSGRWREMPNNGRADLVTAAAEFSDGSRAVEVWVASNNTFWCSVNPDGRWRAWVQC